MDIHRKKKLSYIFKITLIFCIMISICVYIHDRALFNREYQPYTENGLNELRDQSNIMKMIENMNIYDYDLQNFVINGYNDKKGIMGKNEECTLIIADKITGKLRKNLSYNYEYSFVLNDSVLKIHIDMIPGIVAENIKSTTTIFIDFNYKYDDFLYIEGCLSPREFNKSYQSFQDIQQSTYQEIIDTIKTYINEVVN